MAKWVIKTPADYERAYRAIQAKITKVVRSVPEATARALLDVAIDWISRAVERAPVEFGDLRGSAYVTINGELVAHGNDDGTVTVLNTQSVPAGNAITIEIGFTAPYAFVQHEHVEFEHPLGGEAKYLESVLIEREPAWIEHLKKSAGDAFGGGV